MGTRFLLIIATLTLLSGCIATPRFQVSQRIDFIYTPANLMYTPVKPDPISPEDLMCCAQCVA